MKYPTPTLTALADGALVDQRFRLACQLAQTPGFFRGIEGPTGSAITAGEVPATPAAWRRAGFALDVAAELYAQAADRGWIAPLPLDPDATPEEIAHVRRQAGANVQGQIHGQREAQAQMARVQQVPGMVLNG